MTDVKADPACVGGEKKPLSQRLWLGFANPLRVIGGFVLIALVGAAGALAVIFFSATQFQTRTAELSINGTPLTIWRVEKLRGEFSNWNATIFQLRKSIVDARDTLRKAESQKNLFLDDADNGLKLLQRDLARLETRLKIAPPAGSAPDDVDARLAAAETKIAASTPVDTSAQQELTRLQAAGRKFESDRAGQVSWAATARENKNQLDLQESELKAKLSEVSRLFGATSSDIAPEVVEKVINITSELEAMANIWGGRIYDVALWTNDMLVLLLVISMGVLGSALHLLAVFVMNEKESMSFGEYPLRLAFGAVTAIVVYIIAKSGLPVLADTTKIGGGAPINPYFISLLAIVSGLMSDRAWIRYAGSQRQCCAAWAGPILARDIYAWI